MFFLFLFHTLMLSYRMFKLPTGKLITLFIIKNVAAFAKNVLLLEKLELYRGPNCDPRIFFTINFWL